MTVFTLGCAMAFCLGDDKRANTPSALAEWQFGLLGKIKQCLTDNSFDFRLPRIAEEFSTAGFANREIRQTFLRLYVQGIDHERLRLMFDTPQFLDAVAAAGPEGIDDILKLVNRKDEDASDEARSRLLFGLGRMGRSGKSAIPKLAGSYEELQAALKYNVSLSLVLANLGDDSPAVRNTLVREVSGDESFGMDRLFPTARAIHPTCKFPADFNRAVKKNVADTFTADLAPRKDKRSEYMDRTELVATLMSFDALDRASVEKTEALFRSALKDGDISAFVFWSAISSASPERRKPVTVELLKGLSAIFDRVDKSQGFVHYGIYDMVNSPTATMLAELLKSEDREVANGAASMLEWSGAKARDTVPELLKYLVKHGPDSAASARIIRVLHRIATYSQIPEIEKAIKGAPGIRRELEFVKEAVLAVRATPPR